MKKLIVANWKMNPDSPARAVRLAKQIEAGVPASKKIEVVIAPPFPFLEDVKKVIKKAKLGAQNMSDEKRGAHTGEVSANELKNLGVSYVILGHSERRALGETDEMINKKVIVAFQENVTVILCVGEPLSVRKKGIAAAKKFVADQLKKDLRGIENWELPARRSFGTGGKIENLTIAYEPIWAISSVSHGKSDTPEDAVEMITFIKSILHSPFSILHFRVLYGGSVNAQNAASFLCYNEIDGALVGGASLKPKEFIKIVNIAGNTPY